MRGWARPTEPVERIGISRRLKTNESSAGNLLALRKRKWVEAFRARDQASFSFGSRLDEGRDALQDRTYRSHTQRQAGRGRPAAVAAVACVLGRGWEHSTQGQSWRRQVRREELEKRGGGGAGGGCLAVSRAGLMGTRRSGTHRSACSGALGAGEGGRSCHARCAVLREPVRSLPVQWWLPLRKHDAHAYALKGGVTEARPQAGALERVRKGATLPPAFGRPLRRSGGVARGRGKGGVQITELRARGGEGAWGQEGRSTDLHFLRCLLAPVPPATTFSPLRPMTVAARTRAQSQ